MRSYTSLVRLLGHIDASGLKLSQLSLPVDDELDKTLKSIPFVLLKHCRTCSWVLTNFAWMSLFKRQLPVSPFSRSQLSQDLTHVL